MEMQVEISGHNRNFAEALQALKRQHFDAAVEKDDNRFDTSGCQGKGRLVRRKFGRRSFGGRFFGRRRFRFGVCFFVCGGRFAFLR
jgi:hypothetical protein